jgi:hypothetical protein
LITGSGLKDIGSAMQSVAGEGGYTIGRDPESMHEAVARLGLPIGAPF